MSQKIFDVNNEEDMDLLWSILPIGIIRAVKHKDKTTFWSELFYEDIPSGFININWQDKTEIIRPVNYEDMIGCVGWFWDNDGEEKSLGVLTAYKPETKFSFVKGNKDNTYFYFRPAKKSELKFYGEDK